MERSSSDAAATVARPGTPPPTPSPTRQLSAAVLSGGGSSRATSSRALSPSGSGELRLWWPPGGSPALALHLVAGAMTTLLQLMVALSTWRHTQDSAGRAAMLLMCACKLALLALVLRRPAVYWANRAWATPCIRIMFHLFPVVRSTGVGTSLLLERPVPAPGFIGALADAARILAGTRQLGAVVGGLVLLMPPAQMLLTQVATLLLTRNEDYCSLPLLVHPLAQERTALVARVLEYATLPILLLKPSGTVAAPIVAAAQSGTKLCRAVLTFSEVALMVVLPTLVSVHWWRPAPAPRRPLLSRTHAAPPASTAPHHAQQPAALALCRRLSGGVERCFDAANRALRFCLRSPAGLMSRLFVSHWLLTITWWLCLRSHGLRLRGLQ